MHGMSALFPTSSTCTFSLMTWKLHNQLMSWRVHPLSNARNLVSTRSRGRSALFSINFWCFQHRLRWRRLSFLVSTISSSSVDPLHFPETHLAFVAERISSSKPGGRPSDGLHGVGSMFPHLLLVCCLQGRLFVFWTGASVGLPSFEEPMLACL